MLYHEGRWPRISSNIMLYGLDQSQVHTAWLSNFIWCCAYEAITHRNFRKTLYIRYLCLSGCTWAFYSTMIASSTAENYSVILFLNRKCWRTVRETKLKRKMDAIRIDVCPYRKRTRKTDTKICTCQKHNGVIGYITRIRRLTPALQYSWMVENPRSSFYQRKESKHYWHRKNSAAVCIEKCKFKSEGRMWASSRSGQSDEQKGCDKNSSSFQTNNTIRSHSTIWDDDDGDIYLLQQVLLGWLPTVYII